MGSLKHTIAKALREVADKIDSGTCELTESEAEHIKQAMLEVYDVEDEGEAPAYTVGYIAMKILRVKLERES